MALNEKIRDAVEEGWTLPVDWYVEEAIFQLEQSLIFERSWQYVGQVSSLETPGDYITAQIGKVPVVVVRNKKGELTGFVNVCLHRCAEIVQGAGHRNTLRCHYHAWVYDLDGALISAPRSDREERFELSDFRLERVRVETFGPFVFANVSSDGPSLALALGELPERLARDGMDLDAVQLVERSEWEVQANWKVVVENYDECYHCPVAHPSFSRVMEVSPDDYVLEYGRWWSRATTPLRTWPTERRPALPYDPAGVIGIGSFAWLWPNFTLVQNPGPRNIMAFYFVPKGPDRTVVVSEYMFGENASQEVVKQMVDFNLLVGAEDQRLVESVQRGMRSSRVPRGRLLLDSEKLIQHFQRLVYEALAG